MEGDHVSREELRRRLRAKIKGKRDPQAQSDPRALQQELRADPAGSLLRLGVDDVDILKSAESIVREPHKLLSALKAEPSDAADDEELPPEF